LKQIGLKGRGVGSTSNGLAVVGETLKKWGVPDGWTMRDGSGLSSENRFSCDDFDVLLDRFAGKFPQLLAVAGKSGTLREMFLDTPMEGILVGKTGTLSGVKALAGYVPIDGDEPVRFVLLLNRSGIDNKSAYRPLWALLGDGLRRASAGPRMDDLAP
ncbi:MAG: putative D-alanyl-D-alanine carboxypeptidase, partial [Actinomycetota bacterium]